MATKRKLRRKRYKNLKYLHYGTEPLPACGIILSSEERRTKDFLRPSLPPESKLSPEKKLLQAILCRAVCDLYEKFDTNKITRKSAVRWFKGTTNKPFSFSHVCHALGLSRSQAETLRSLADMSPANVRELCLRQLRWRYQ